MNHETEHAAAHDAPFTAAEVQEFQAQDYSAGAAVVGLMLSIFAIGVVLYLIVAVTVGSS